MTKAEFHNALRVLRSIDRHEVGELPPVFWSGLRDRPYEFFIQCSDAHADIIWAAIEKRM